jgi:hypothetical protein
VAAVHARDRTGPVTEEADGAPRRRRPMSRIGDLMPHAAARLGLEGELRRARFLATFDAIVAERVPAAHGACRALKLEGETLVVEADAPIVGQELMLHGDDLATAFRAAPGGAPVRGLRVVIRRRHAGTSRGA